ncbi:MAG: undecaprenyl-phosphate glucose phosphotransferase [Alphaproteobacteria bacterium]
MNASTAFNQPARPVSGISPADASKDDASKDDVSKSAGGHITSRKISSEVVARFQKSLDAAALLTLGLMVEFALFDHLTLFESVRAISLVMLATFTFIVVAREAGAYSIAHLGQPWSGVLRLGISAAAAGFVVMAASLAAGFDLARLTLWVLAWWAFSLTILGAARLIVGKYIRRWGQAGRLAVRVAVVGGGRELEAVLDRLSRVSRAEVDVCGYFDDRGNARDKTHTFGVPRLGDIDDLVEFSRWFRIDTVIVAMPLVAENRLWVILKRLWVMPANIRISALSTRLRFNRRAYSQLGDVPLLDTFDRPISEWDYVVKSVVDRILAALMIVALSPVMLATMIAIRWDSKGSVLFRQRRYGFNNELVEVFKFRSMYIDNTDQNAAKLVTRGDPRVTRVGRFIRKTSLDELPQLFNVLRGDLSLVGPRPHALKAKAADRLYDEVVEGYFARHRVKPGVTGWAQIKGWRGETDTTEKIEARVEHDIYYIDNWSLWLDLYIIAATPFSLLNTNDAF